MWESFSPSRSRCQKISSDLPQPRGCQETRNCWCCAAFLKCWSIVPLSYGLNYVVGWFFFLYAFPFILTSSQPTTLMDYSFFFSFWFSPAPPRNPSELQLGELCPLPSALGTHLHHFAVLHFIVDPTLSPCLGAQVSSWEMLLPIRSTHFSHLPCCVLPIVGWKINSGAMHWGKNPSRAF